MLRREAGGTDDVGPLHAANLLIASAGPGSFLTLMALQSVTWRAGARVMIVTAQPDGEGPREADTVITVPAQAMAKDRSARNSLLPMASLYEAAQLDSLTWFRFCAATFETNP